jgi:hypothetical protein
MAQLSTTISQAQRATAFHCYMSERELQMRVRSEWKLYLLNFKAGLLVPCAGFAFAGFACAGFAFGLLCYGDILHVNVRHVYVLDVGCGVYVGGDEARGGVIRQAGVAGCRFVAVGLWWACHELEGNSNTTLSLD